MSNPRPAPIRGRITVPDRMTGREFMYNPPEIEDDQSPVYGSLQVPGASHPIYQYGSGGERLIPFELYLDGDRGRLGRLPPGTNADGVQNAIGGRIVDITDEVRFYQSLRMPRRYGGTDIKTVFPPVVIFTFGTAFQQVQCIVKQAKPRYTAFTANLEPIRAIVSMVLAEVPDESQTAEDYWPEGAGGPFI